jgi:sulfite exporter TauE/SafE
MNNIVVVAFITGLTAGGLSCFAVQGGLLSGSIAQRVEATSRERDRGAATRKKKKRHSDVKTRPAEMIQPIMLFMAAKLLAYTMLGFLLGWSGSMFSFSPTVKGFIQLAVGVFLVGNALRMLNVHPVFRYFSFEPPSWLTRYIRQVSKQDNTWLTPLFLGALTVLIPCGVTQSMMAVAIGTGSPWLGAVIMFAFILGTSPTFIGISWLVTSLSGVFQKYFNKIVAVFVLLLGLYAMRSGLSLAGSPVTLAKILRTFQPDQIASVYSSDGPSSNVSAAGSSVPLEGGNVAKINATNIGYSPYNLILPANQLIELHLVTNKTIACTRAFVIPAMNIQEILPATGERIVNIPAQAAGTTMDFMCSMGMYTGLIEFK